MISISKQSGFILIIIFIVSLAISIGLRLIFEKSFFTQIIAENDNDYLIAKEGAEIGLLLGEAQIRGEQSPIEPSLAHITYRVQLGNIDSCKKKHYRVFSSAEYHHARVALVSEYDYLISAGTIPCKKEIINRRVFWGVI